MEPWKPAAHIQTLTPDSLRWPWASHFTWCLKEHFRNFTGGSVVKTLHFHYTGAWVQSLVRKLRSWMLQPKYFKTIKIKMRLFILTLDGSRFSEHYNKCETQSISIQRLESFSTGNCGSMQTDSVSKWKWERTSDPIKDQWTFLFWKFHANHSIQIEMGIPYWIWWRIFPPTPLPNTF